MTLMSRSLIVGALGAAVLIGSGSWAAAEEKRMTEAEIRTCQQDLQIDPNGDRAMTPVQLPPAQTCRSDLKKNGFAVPDPACTPGAVNPTLTLTALKDPAFRTDCVRNQATPESRSSSEEHSSKHFKTDTYGWYGVPKPTDNEGKNQTCELDHFISLELGGADTLDNIWPQCGPADVTLDNRFFKEKDTVENYLAWMVKHGEMELDEAQKGIAADWTQYLDKARNKCPHGDCPKQ
jgi:hypothetical protein